MAKRIYLDYAAATPLDSRVKKAMEKALHFGWANSSSLHEEGGMSKNILEESRQEIARLLRVRQSEIYFTSGGTEALNISLAGILKNKESPHMISSSIEHPALLEAVKNAGKNGALVSFVTPDDKGIINSRSIEREIRENTVLICLMHANNEIGTIQPVREVGNLIKNYREKNNSSYPYLLVDASQSTLYEDVSPERLAADILVLDGIKMYGPRGAGILFVKHNVEIAPVIFGGGQERGLRSGTEDSVRAAGLAEALKIATEKREEESKRLSELRDYAIQKILSSIPHSSLNGDPERRLPNNINICFGGEDWTLDSEFLVIKLDTLGFAVSAASACQNLSLENSSYVIESLGKLGCTSSSLRFTLGRETKKSDIDRLVDALKSVCYH